MHPAPDVTPIAPAPPPWLLHARAELGVHGFPPGRSNPRITAYHAGTNIAGYDDKAAWCSSFVQWCLARCGLAGTGSALARSWLEWGVPIGEPRHGCIAVLARDDPAGWRGHVGFYLRHDGEQVHLLGGNQRDSVCEHAYPLASVLGWRWPADDDDTLFVTRRTRLRRLREGDAAAMHRVYGDREAMRYVGDGEPLTLEGCQQWISVTFGNLERRGYGMCAVVALDDPAEMLGCCGLVHPGGQPDAELEFAFRSDCWGRGYAGEVVPALVHYGLAVLRLPRVVATVAPAHRVVQRVLERAGLIRGNEHRNDDASLSAMYAIGRLEPRIRRARPGEAGALSDLAFETKASWGYSADDLERWRGELRIDETTIATGAVWVAENEAGLAGVLVCAETAPRWSLEHLWVAPAQMRRGVGQALLTQAVQRAAAAGAAEILIDSDPNAEAFYQRCGARRVGAIAAPLYGDPGRVRPQLLLAVAHG